MSSGKLKLEMMPLGKLKKWPRNPKEHDIPGITDAFIEFGYIDPILIDERTGKIIAGHGRLDSLLDLKKGNDKPPRYVEVVGKTWKVPVLRGIKFANDLEAELHLIGDNKITIAGGYDMPTLTVQLMELADNDMLPGTGFSQEDVEEIKMAHGHDLPEVEAEDGGQYSEGVVKQMIVPFKGNEFDLVIERLQVVMEENNFDNFTATFLFLLDHYEQEKS